MMKLILLGLAQILTLTKKGTLLNSVHHHQILTNVVTPRTFAPPMIVQPHIRPALFPPHTIGTPVLQSFSPQVPPVVSPVVHHIAPVQQVIQHAPQPIVQHVVQPQTIVYQVAQPVVQPMPVAQPVAVLNAAHTGPVRLGPKVKYSNIETQQRVVPETQVVGSQQIVQKRLTRDSCGNVGEVSQVVGTQPITETVNKVYKTTARVEHQIDVNTGLHDYRKKMKKLRRRKRRL